MIEETSIIVSAELMDHPEIRKTVTALKGSAFFKELLLGYESSGKNIKLQNMR